MVGKVAVLGSADFVMPFSALGVDTFAADTSEQILDMRKKIIKEKYALIVVAENVASKAEQVFEPYQKNATPAIVIVPFTTESKGETTKSLSDALRMATGIDILKNN